MDSTKETLANLNVEKMRQSMDALKVDAISDEALESIIQVLKQDEFSDSKIGRDASRWLKDKYHLLETKGSNAVPALYRVIVVGRHSDHELYYLGPSMDVVRQHVRSQGVTASGYLQCVAESIGVVPWKTPFDLRQAMMCDKTVVEVYQVNASLKARWAYICSLGKKGDWYNYSFN